MPGQTADAGDATERLALERDAVRGAPERAWHIRALPALPAAAVIVAVLVWMAFHDGGYFPSVFTSAGAVAFIALAVLLAVRPPQQRFSRRTLVAIGALVAFSGWAGLSRAWTVVPDVPLLDMQRAMLYVALFGLGLIASDSGRHARLFVWSVLGVFTVVVGAGLLSRIQPELLDLTRGEVVAYRLDYPLGYWNAFGGMAAVGAVLALGLAGDRRAVPALRTVAAGISVLLVVAMYLSLSRGAWLALIVGLLALVAIAPNRGTLLLTLFVAGAAATLAILRLRAYPALVTDPTAGSGQSAQGSSYTRELLLLVVGAAVAQAALTFARVPAVLRRRARVRPVVAAAATVALIAVVLGGAVTTPASDARTWLDREWQEFLDPTTDPGDDATRLLTAKGQRSDAYRVAIDAFEEHPFVGGGAGSFEVRYMRDRSIDLKLRDAHSLPLETLSELGSVGLLILLVFFGAVGAAARRAVARMGVLRAQEAAAVTAAFVVWLAHAWVDWSWSMPVFTGAVVALSAALFQSGRRRKPRPRLAAGSRRALRHVAT